MRDELDQAITSLYGVFRTYPLRARIDSCPHCELDSAERALHAKPLKALGWDALDIYLFKAMTTFGGESDFKHFLPRIFELFARDLEGAGYDVDLLFDKLDYATWTSWPKSEIDAVREFVASWRRHLLAQPNPSDDDGGFLKELLATLNQFLV